MATRSAQGRTSSLTVPRHAFTVREFCDAYRISKTHAYELWRRGQGPKTLRAGNKVLITVQAAREWAGDARAAA